jgi:hypothetical protein
LIRLIWFALLPKQSLKTAIDIMGPKHATHGESRIARYDMLTIKQAKEQFDELTEHMEGTEKSNTLSKERRVQALGALAPYMPLIQMVFRRRSNVALRTQSELDDLLPKLEERYVYFCPTSG